MQENAVYRYVARFGQGVFRLPRPMFGPNALLPRSARLVSRITATKFIPRLTARWNALSSTRWRAMQLRRLIYLRLRRYFRHRSEPDWHFREKPIHLGVQVERVVLNA